MIRSRVVSRPASSLANLDNLAGVSELPPCYAFRLVPLPADPTNGMLAGQFPVTLVKPNGGEPLIVVDSSVHYFAHRLADENGKGVFAVTGNALAAPDRWLIVWTDDPKDELRTPADPAPSLVWDSGVVAAGAQIQTPVLDLSRLTSLEVLVDNVAANALRDLTLASFLPDGTTQVDSVILRRCGFGAAPSGSSYVPGKVRGYVGPNPPGGTTGEHVLYDATGGANAAVSSPNLWTEDGDSLKALVMYSGGGVVGGGVYSNTIADDGTTVGGPVMTGATTQFVTFEVGPGVAAVSSPGGASFGYWPSSLPRRMSFTGLAGGGALTTRLVVLLRGRIPGTFAQQMLLPPRAQLTLAAGGGANGRLTVIGR